MPPNYQDQMANLQQLQQQVVSLSSLVSSKANSIQQRETLLKQGQLPAMGVQALEKNLRRNLGPMLAPGNVGDINSVIWPYFFTTGNPIDIGGPGPIGPTQTFQTGFSVTQEAAFVMMSFTKTVYISNGGSLGYLTPSDEAPSAPGLTFTITDGSSSRQFFNSPMKMDMYGNPRFPTKWPRPIMFLPNQNVQVSFANAHPVNSYVPLITAFGYRIRMEAAQSLLGLVYG